MTNAENATTTPDGTATAKQSIAISGASGMVGTALSDMLRDSGHSVISMSRKVSDSDNSSIVSNPASGLKTPTQLEGVGTVIHLAGENIAAGRWTKALKDRIRSSRVEGTRNLVKSISAVGKKPQTLVCASAIGYYGNRGDTVLDENAAAGKGFLADVCRDWEHEALAAAELGLRVVCVRIGVVLSPKGGALAKMLLPFKMGLGGIIGTGKQYWSWIGLHDLVRIIAFCVENESVQGAVNAVSPNSMTNYDFTNGVGKALHRPTIFPLPAFAAKLALGEMANELLLASTRVVPKKLQDAGFRFDYPELVGCLEHELS
ncbi:MAG TPA: TIGR01777 family oxidoreductase [Planctomycetaceae bacterium]|nr:TIGR01777 family oxidoreductase [Planctomycetaceae bacterium]